MFTDFLLNRVVFEIRYKKGHRYWDRCGETTLKIEEENPEWRWARIGNGATHLTNAERDMQATFSWGSVSVRQSHVENLNQFKLACDRLSKIILSNLEIREISRIGNRYWYVLAHESIEKAENFIAKGKILEPNIPKLSAFGTEILNRDFTIVLEHDGLIHRIAVGSASRPKDENLDRNEEFLRFNPLNALLVDIDAFTTKTGPVDKFIPSDFIQKTSKRIEHNLMNLFK